MYSCVCHVHELWLSKQNNLTCGLQELLAIFCTDQFKTSTHCTVLLWKVALSCMAPLMSGSKRVNHNDAWCILNAAAMGWRVTQGDNPRCCEQQFGGLKNARNSGNVVFGVRGTL